MLPVLSIDLFIEPLFSFGSVSFGLLIYLFFFLEYYYCSLEKFCREVDSTTRKSPPRPCCP